MTTSKNIITVSNGLSTLRLFLAIPIWFLIESFDVPEIRLITFVVCLIAASTDFLDGYLARKRNEITELGKVLDPLADKVLVGLIALKLFLIEEINGYYLLIILLRDLLIFLGGIYLTIKLKKILPSNLLGKIAVTVIAFVFLLIIIGFDKQNIIFVIFYFGSIVLIVASFGAYVLRAYEFLKKSKENENIRQSAR